MKMTVFSKDVPRIISKAYYNTYIKGILHPNRTMTDHDFVYICSGQWEIWQESTPYILNEGDVIILTAGLNHSGVIPCIDKTKTMYIHVSEYNDKIIDSDLKDSEEIAEDICLAPVIHCINYPKVRKTFQEMAQIYAMDIPYKNTRLSALFQILLTTLYDVQESGDIVHKSEVVDKVLKVIHESPQRFYTNKQLADMFFVSTKTLVEHFRNSNKVTPYQYQINYKLNGVEAFLLDKPQVKLREVAQNFGFYDEFHLSKIFKQKFGVSPNNYRKKSFLE